MKSIIQESSSIEKAVKQSWEKAGQPTQFSIKILEIEEKNFLGFTKKPAKIAIFFEEKKIQQPTTKKRKVIPKQKLEKKQPKKDIVRSKQHQTKSSAKSEKQIETKTSQHKDFWTKELVDTTTQWTKGFLETLQLQNIKFATVVKQKNLTFNFYQPLMTNKKKQTILFKNMSFLLMQVLRYKFKKAFRSLHIIFTSK